MAGTDPDEGARTRAFEELFDRQFSRCVQLAVRIVHDREVGREVAAEAFARAWSRWPRLERSGNPDGWVLRVTVNRAIDVTRRRPVAGHPPVASTIDEVVVLRVALVEALRHLPRRQREVITLRYLSDLTDTEVGNALGISVTTVKTHLGRGLSRLRSLLPNDEVEVQLGNGT